MNYLQEIANRIKSFTPANELPDDDTSALFLTYATLLLAKGSRVSGQDVHNAWVAWMTPIDPGHESLVPFDQLDPETRREDSPFVRAIRATANEMDS